MTHVYQATIDDIDLITPLFDRYRQFYGKPTDLNAARQFLLERLNNHQSVIFVAIAENGDGTGFTQLFPSFSSVSMARIFILNDLYVDTGVRRGGVAANLLSAAAQYGRSVGAIRLTLSTGMDNDRAKALYRSKGWQQEEVFQVFELELKA
jgi:GNAT superfamily N-acetyltransferase